MTDITELAQREKFEAWWDREYKHLESSKYTDAVPHIKYGFWMAYQAGGAELAEALEKVQETIAFQQGEIKALFSSLECRTVTVKLPPKIERNYVDGWFSHKGVLVGGGAAEWYNKALDDVIAELAAQGIKVEAE